MDLIVILISCTNCCCESNKNIPSFVVDFFGIFRAGAGRVNFDMEARPSDRNIFTMSEVKYSSDILYFGSRIPTAFGTRVVPVQGFLTVFRTNLGISRP